MTKQTVRTLILVFALCSASRAEAANITLEWDRNTESTVTGYLVSYGTQSGNYSTTVDVVNEISWSVALNPATPTSYFFAVRAYGSTGTSAYSAQVSTTIAASAPRLTLDNPGTGSRHPSDFLISGWGVDTASTTGTGIDAVHVYAYPNPGSGAAPRFLGAASYGGSRPDVAAFLGASRYTNSGYSLPVVGLPAGVWQLTAYARSTVTNGFTVAKSAQITVYSTPPAATGQVAVIDIPVTSTTATSWLSVGGWALDVRSTSGPGVDVVQVWAYPNPGSGAAPLFLGNAVTGRARADVAAAFGSRFLKGGYHLDVLGISEGIYDIVVLPRSSVTGAYEVARVTRVTVRPSIRMNVDSPIVNGTVGTTFTLSGWAHDRRSTDDAGVDVLHVWAYRAGSSLPPMFVGVASTGISRPDVAAVFGSQFSHSGYSMVGSLSAGTYDLVVFAHSEVSGMFENARVVRITVQ
jgi:hypothetical protein